MTVADAPIRYMERTRHYYRALGYARDYVWAHFEDVPFAKLAKPLSQARIALITTASPSDFDGVKRVWSGRSSVAPSPKSQLIEPSPCVPALEPIVFDADLATGSAA